MLKIKDDVTIEQLSEYGFDEDIEDWLLCNDIGDNYHGEPIFELMICISNAEKYDVEKNVLFTGVSYIPNVLMEMIKDGIVEKGE